MELSVVNGNLLSFSAAIRIRKSRKHDGRHLIYQGQGDPDAPEEAEDRRLGREVFDAVHRLQPAGADETSREADRPRGANEHFFSSFCDAFPRVERAVFEAGDDLYLARAFSERT